MRLAVWQRHVNAVNPPPALRHWLTGNGSLTAKLRAHSQVFRVRRLHQARAVCLADEAAAIGLAGRRQVWEREVVLECDGHPAIFAHTVVPLSANATDWPLFSALGERSLGSTLFGDPRVQRAELEFARLRPSHPLMRRAALALGWEGQKSSLLARRCVYRRGRGLLLVTEVFLPAVLELKAGGALPIIDKQNN